MVDTVCFLSSPETDDQLPKEEEDEQGREHDVHQRVGHEEDTASDDGDGRADGGQVELHAVFELVGFQPNQQGGDDFFLNKYC